LGQYSGLVNIKHYPPHYYQSKKELQTIPHHVKLFICPHCKRFGTLNLHGYLYGHGEEATVSIRGIRLYCSNRRQGNVGCGRTCSIMASHLLKGFSFNTLTLWKVMVTLLHGSSLYKVITSLFEYPRSGYRFISLFVGRQPFIRALLRSQHPPPRACDSSSPLIQTLHHFIHTFPAADTPLSSFQHCFQKALL